LSIDNDEVKNVTTDAEPADPKRARILEAAMTLVLAYGFSRTTMDDIARAAEMSRPALYLLFRNKTEIYRAIAGQHLDQSVSRAEAILRQEGAFSDRMMSMIEECLIGMMRRIAESPHGAEILDMKSTLAGDIVSGWKQRLGALIAAAIEAEATANGLDLQARGLSARLLATLLLDGLEGMKSRIRNPDEQRAAARGLVRVVEIALQA
jgi:AcrR family transcriptional regulator